MVDSVVMHQFLPLFGLSFAHKPVANEWMSIKFVVTHLKRIDFKIKVLMFDK